MLKNPRKISIIELTPNFALDINRYKNKIDKGEIEDKLTMETVDAVYDKFFTSKYQTFTKPQVALDKLVANFHSMKKKELGVDSRTVKFVGNKYISIIDETSNGKVTTKYYEIKI